MPVCQFIVTAADNIAFTQYHNYYPAIVPITVYKPCNLSGRYKARVVSINWVDFIPAADDASLNYVVTIDSTTWRFPTSGIRGISFSNRARNVQLFPPDKAPSFEILNTGAQMDLLISAQTYNNSGVPNPPPDYPFPTYNWLATNFSHMILTLDLEKVPEMV
jgi:hypothetical protein